jgi:hypothetical protein
MSLGQRKRITLAEWIDENWNLDGVPVDVFELVHIVAGAAEVAKHVHSIHPNGTQKSDELERAFLHKANTCAQDLPGMQVFEVRAYYGKSSQHSTYFNLPMPGKTDYSMGTEPPTREGRTQQEMRHNEVMFQTLVKSNERTQDILLRVLDASMRDKEALIRDVASLRRDSTEAFIALRDKVLEDSVKLAEIEIVKRKEMAKIDLQAFGVKMLPAALNGIMGKEILPQNNADTELLSVILSRIPEAMIPAMIQQLGLTDEVGLALVARKRQQRQEGERTDEAAKQVGDVKTDRAAE